MLSYKPQDDLHDPGQAHTDEVHSHAVPLWILFSVFGALVFLTFLTVFFAHPYVKEQVRIFVNEHFYSMSAAEVSRFSLHLAMAIATLKGALVVLFFMHLWWDRPFNAVVFIGTLAFVALFIGYTLADVTTYSMNERAVRTELDPTYSAAQVRARIEDRRQQLANQQESEATESSDTTDEDAEPQSPADVDEAESDDAAQAASEDSSGTED